MDIKPIDYKVWGEPPTLHNPEFHEVANVVISFKTEDLCPKDDPFGKKTIAEVKHRVETHEFLVDSLRTVRDHLTETKSLPLLLSMVNMCVLKGESK